MGDDFRTPQGYKENRTISRNWFTSLSRRKKSPTNHSTAECEDAPRTSSEDDSKRHDEKPKKDEKNIFQKIRHKMEMRFPSMQRKIIAPKNEEDINANADGTKPYEQDTESCKPLTDSYRGYIAKKWLEQESGPNLVMFKACSEMISHVWYWGEISRHDAQKQLTDKPNGSFLVRDSETTGSQFTLSFRIGNCTLHYRIQHRDNYWHFEELHYESIVELIEDIMLRSTDENFVCYVKVKCEMQPPFPVMLKYPISRYLKIPPLQDLCRRAIQRYILPEQIEKLPIPIKLQNYLVEKASLTF